MVSIVFRFSVFFALIVGGIHAAQGQVPTLPEVPDSLPSETADSLLAKRMRLEQQRKGVLESGVNHNRRCNAVKEGSADHGDCVASLGRLVGEIQVLRAAAEKLQMEIDVAVLDAAQATAAENARVIKALNAYAQRQRWSAESLARLDKALHQLGPDGAPATLAQVRQTWKEVLSRGTSTDLASQASAGEGPGFPGAGTQTNYEDCAVFALANASGRPYGFVSALATKLIREGDWRRSAERANPQRTIEQHGLIGGEVVILAEALGQAEVIRSSDFAKTVKAGRRVMVNVLPPDARGGHQVVLTKAFQHAGDTWFEVIDSNQGPLRRLYLTTKELGILLQENGVAYQAEPKTTPKLLR